jgi:uncharacterized membrane protein
MIFLIVGVTLFFGIHLLPSLSIKVKLVERVGENSYKLIFSVVSLTGLGLIIYGFKLSEFVSLWDPLPWGRSATYWVMPIAIVLICAADVPNNIKRVVRHPMLIALTLWGATHLAANGDLASTILFASFAIYSVLDITLVEFGGRFKAAEAVSAGWDVGVVAFGLTLTGGLFYFHEYFAGVPLM